MSNRSYAQYCGVARALDVIGERWTMLIVRELLIRPARYGDLSAALPGIASNLLAQRLRALEAAGVLERRVDPGRNGILYALTPWGEGLAEPVEALARWSVPLMATGRRGDAFQGHWILIALRALLAGHTSAGTATVGIDMGDARVEVRSDASGTSVTLTDMLPAGTLVRGDPELVLALAAGLMSVEDAVARDAVVGDLAPLRTVLGVAT